MTQLVTLIQNFTSSEKSAHALTEWSAFKQAKTDLKRAFHAIDTALFSMDDFYTKINAQCGAKTAKKIKEFAKKEKSSFSPITTKKESLPESFLVAAGKLEEATGNINQQPAYQEYRSAKKVFKKLVKEAAITELQAEFEKVQTMLTSQGVDVAKIGEKMSYWARKQ